MRDSQALRQLALASDFEVVRVFEKFANRISDSVKILPAELVSQLPAELQIVDGRNVSQELDENAEQTLTPGTSVQAARKLLAIAAEDESLSRLVSDSFENWHDDEQLVDVVLAIGLVGSVWLILASSEIKLEDGRFVFQKKANTNQQLKAFAEVIRAIRGTRVK